MLARNPNFLPRRCHFGQILLRLGFLAARRGGGVILPEYLTLCKCLKRISAVERGWYRMVIFKNDLITKNKLEKVENYWTKLIFCWIQENSWTCWFLFAPCYENIVLIFTTHAFEHNNLSYNLLMKYKYTA